MWLWSVRNAAVCPVTSYGSTHGHIGAQNQVATTVDALMRCCCCCFMCVRVGGGFASPRDIHNSIFFSRASWGGRSYKHTSHDIPKVPSCDRHITWTDHQSQNFSGRSWLTSASNCQDWKLPSAGADESYAHGTNRYLKKVVYTLQFSLHWRTGLS